MRIFAPLIFLASTGCFADETVSGYADPDAVYALQELHGAPWPARATITFPEQGKVTGQAPCNTWAATQLAPYPWISLGPVIATERACPDLAAEADFFAALATMTLAEFSGPSLILSTDAGVQMVFKAE